MSHTPEPWRAEWQPGQTPKHTYTHCVMVGDDSLCDTLTKADAYRIVACVNACTGMADPVAEVKRLREETKLASAFVEEARELLACVDKLGLRKLVAGWHGEGKPDGPYPPHPKDLGCKLDTKCGLVVLIDRAAEALRKHDAALSAKEVG